jgi:C1A family cysteine protease
MTKSRLLIGLCASVFMYAVPILGISEAMAQPGDVQWDAVIGLSPTETEGGQDAWAGLPQVAARMQPLGIKANVNAGKLALSGAQDMEQLRAALFDEAAEWADFLGGPVEVTLSLPTSNQPLRLELESRPGTGYRWVMLPSDEDRYTQIGDTTFAMRYAGPGAPAVQTIDIRSIGAGDGVVHLVYRRSFEPDEPIRARLTLRVARTSGVIELTDPTPSQPIIGGDAQSASHAADAAASLPRRATLPTDYDARTLGIIPSVRNQGACGSCWAFGTVGVMEVAVKLGGGPLTDLSEQFLVSCNKNGWNCDGGLTASKYHYNTLGYSQTAAGAVLESVKPYTASNGTCPSDYAKAHKATAWQFLTGSEWTMPTNDQIKNAIMTYGAVTAGVCADDGWDSYTGGVYNPSSNDCDGSTNHQILLIGWSDSTQSWILRNSWGAGWGESGYMRIKYDPAGKTSRVGEGASWIRYGSGLYTLTVNSSGASAVAITANPTTYAGTTNYSKTGIASGTAITLTAPATASSKTFASWTGCDSTSGTSCTLSMTGNRPVTATYATPTSVDLVVTKIVLTPSSPSTFSAKVTVKNQGTVSGDGGWLDVWTNQSSSQGCGSDGNKFKPVGIIAAGASRSFAFTGLSTRSAGNKTFRAFVDSYCQTTEANEGNNQLTLVYTVQ